MVVTALSNVNRVNSSSYNYSTQNYKKASPCLTPGQSNVSFASSKNPAIIKIAKRLQGTPLMQLLEFCSEVVDGVDYIFSREFAGIAFKKLCPKAAAKQEIRAMGRTLLKDLKGFFPKPELKSFYRGLLAGGEPELRLSQLSLGPQRIVTQVCEHSSLKDLETLAEETPAALKYSITDAGASLTVQLERAEEGISETIRLYPLSTSTSPSSTVRLCRENAEFHLKPELVNIISNHFPSTPATNRNILEIITMPGGDLRYIVKEFNSEGELIKTSGFNQHSVPIRHSN
ncbi:MAG: hypothetical protein PHC64_03825 [Candidatus Gastranaerophilales bacterium]|nr:hypothetical protein [Candidatus Gastranaerophilales bacterium]